MAPLALSTTCHFHYRLHQPLFLRQSPATHVSAGPIGRSWLLTSSSSATFKSLSPIKANGGNQGEDNPFRRRLFEPIFVCLVSIGSAFAEFRSGRQRIDLIDQEATVSQDSPLNIEDPRVLKIKECLESMSQFLELKPEEMDYELAKSYAKSRVENLDFAWKTLEEMLRADSSGESEGTSDSLHYSSLKEWKVAYKLYQKWISTYKVHQKRIEDIAKRESGKKERHMKYAHEVLLYVNRLEKKITTAMSSQLFVEMHLNQGRRVLFAERDGDYDSIVNKDPSECDWRHLQSFLEKRIKKLGRDKEKILAAYEVYNSLNMDSSELWMLYKYNWKATAELRVIKRESIDIERRLALSRTSYMKSFKDFYVQNENQENYFYRSVELFLEAGSRKGK